MDATERIRLRRTDPNTSVREITIPIEECFGVAGEVKVSIVTVAHRSFQVSGNVKSPSCSAMDLQTWAEVLLEVE